MRWVWGNFTFQPAVFFWVLFMVPWGTDANAEIRTVTDQLGRTVAVSANPRRVIALAPSITEIVFALGQGNRLVGATRFSDFPAEAANLPKVGSYVHLDLEKIVALVPDLCIAVKDGNPLKTIQRLEKLNVPVYAVDPRNFGAVMDTMAEIGDLLNTASQAASMVRSMRQRIQHVKTQIQTADHRPGVFFQIGISPIVAVGTDTLIHEIIELAGGKNLTRGSIPYPRFSREQVLKLAPEIFIITSMARGKIFKKIKKGWERWPGMPAVKNNRIHLVNSDHFDRASPRLVDGLESLARLIHPDRFEDQQ